MISGCSGKAVCEDPAVEVIKVLSDLLEHESMGLRTYINGTLYSLLTRPKLREEAQALGLEDMLQTLDLSDEDFARQVAKRGRGCRAENNRGRLREAG